MTEANYESIVDEVLQQSNFESGKHSSSYMARQETIMASTGSTMTRESRKHEQQMHRAIENYRRRIYDAWSVLNAAQIIVKTDGSKQYKYNRDVLEQKNEEEEDNAEYTVSADNMRKLFDMVKGMQHRQKQR